MAYSGSTKGLKLSVEYHAVQAGVSLAYFQKLRDIAATIGMRIAYKRSIKFRGHSKASQKPWSLRYHDDTLCCAFRTFAQLERNLRGRAGC